jgi:hypothetical protein
MDNRGMAFEWIETLRRLSGKSMTTFARACGTTVQRVGNLRNRPEGDLHEWKRTECLMRREADISWSRLGKMWDQEYLGDDTVSGKKED